MGETQKETKEINIWNNDRWTLRPESVASDINGDGMNLGNDIFIYFKMAAYEQGVFDRIAKTEDYTLANEISGDKGFLMLGEPEAIKAAMHHWVDQLINSILENRKKGANV